MHLHADDIHVAFGTVKQTGLRYIVGEYIDNEYESFVMSFLKLVEVSRYEVIGIPEPLKPSAELCSSLWQLLHTSEYPPLVLPCGGYYIGEFFSTSRADEFDNNVLQGEKIAEVVRSEDCVFDLVFATNGEQRITFFGIYAGNCAAGAVWRAIPAPRWLPEEAIDIIHSETEKYDAEYIPFDDMMQ